MARRIIDLFDDVISYNPNDHTDSMSLYKDLINRRYGNIFLRNVDRKTTEEILNMVEIQAMAMSNVYKVNEGKLCFPRWRVRERKEKGLRDDGISFKEARRKLAKLENETEIDLSNTEFFDFVTILAKSKKPEKNLWWFFEIDWPPKPCGFGVLLTNDDPFYELIDTMRNDGFLRSRVANYPEEGLFHPFRGDYFGGKIKL